MTRIRRAEPRDPLYASADHPREAPAFSADVRIVAEPSELLQLKCLSLALKTRPHLNRNNTSVPRI
jgi:hypothetical protein